MTLNAFELVGDKTEVETWHFQYTQTKMSVKLNLTNFFWTISLPSSYFYLNHHICISSCSSQLAFMLHYKGLQIGSGVTFS